MAVTDPISGDPILVTGSPGRPGQDAYDLWILAGNDGSRQDFLSAQQGRDGRDGRDGIAGAGALVTRSAGEPIPPWRAVYVAADNTFRLPDPSNPAHRGLVVGVTAAGGVQGASVVAQSIGDLIGASAGFAPNVTLFVGGGGALVVDPPASGWRQIVGTTVGAGHIVVALGEAALQQPGDVLVSEDGVAVPATLTEIRAGTGKGYIRTPELKARLDEIDFAAGPIRPVDAPVGTSAPVSDLVSGLPVLFGAVADGVLNPDGTASGTDNSTALQEYADWCFANKRKMVLPERGTGLYRITRTLVIRTDFEMHGKTALIAPNTRDMGRAVVVGLDQFDFTANTSIPERIPASEYTQWTNVTRRSQWIKGLNNRANQFISVNVPAASQALIRRIGAPDLGMGQGFRVADNVGRLASRLFGDWTINTWQSTNSDDSKNAQVIAKKLTPTITLRGMKIVLYDGKQYLNYPAYTPKNYVVGDLVYTANDKRSWRCIQNHTGYATINTNADGDAVNNFEELVVTSILGVERPNVDLYDVHLDNVSSFQVAQGLKCNHVCNIRVFGWQVHNLYAFSDNYGFNSDNSCDIELYGGACSNVRRCIDANKSTGYRVYGGSFPDGVGAHYGWDINFYGSTIGCRTSTNPQCIHVAGGDTSVIGCTVTVSDPGKTVFQVRPDINEMGGSLRLHDNNIVVGGNEDTVEKMFLIDLRVPTRQYDAGRTVEYPSLISIKGNTINVTNRDPEVTLKLLSIGRDQNAATFIHPVRWQGRIVIEGNDVTYALGNTTAANVSRTYFEYFKPQTAIGAGYDIRIRDLPSLRFQGYTRNYNVDQLDARFNLRVSDISGDLRLLLANGVYKRVNWSDISGAVTTSLSANGVPLQGGEDVGPQYRLTPKTIDAQQTLEIGGAIRLQRKQRADVLAITDPGYDDHVFAVSDRDNRWVVGSLNNGNLVWKFMDGTPL